MKPNDKSSSYLFWLSEYLARNMLVNIGPNAGLLLRFFEIGEMATKGLLEDSVYQPAPKDIAAFINSGTWKTLDAEWMQRFGELFLQSFPIMQREVDALAAYIPDNEKEIERAMQLGSQPLDAEVIIRACINERLPALIEQQFFDAAIAFTDETVTVLDSGGDPRRVGYSDMDVQGSMLRLNVSINLTANLEDILSDITTLVCFGREEMVFQSPQWQDAIRAGYGPCTNDCLGYGPCSGGKCQIDKRHSLDAKVLRKAATSNYTYSARSDAARAVGLWLWDYVRENDCSVGAAVRAIKGQDFLNPLQFSASPDRVFERFYARSRDCIEQKQVLSIDNRVTHTKV